MSGVDEEDEASAFETSLTGRFGIAAVSERERDTVPMRAQGTPRRITAPIVSPFAATARAPAASGPSAPVFRAAPEAAPGSLFDGPTLDRTPFPAVLIEELAALDGNGAERWEDDLAEAGARCWSCSRHIVVSARYCPHCGEAIHTLAQLEDLPEGDDPA
jgi:hypothetical protein